MSSKLSRECNKLRALLPEYAEGKLSPEDKGRVERHLSSCDRCAQEVEDLRAVLQSLRSVGSEEAPENLVPRVQRSVRQSATEGKPTPAFWARLAVPAAVLTGVIAVSFALYAPKQPTFVPGGGVPPPQLQTKAAVEDHARVGKPVSPVQREVDRLNEVSPRDSTFEAPRKELPPPSVHIAGKEKLASPQPPSPMMEEKEPKTAPSAPTETRRAPALGGYAGGRSGIAGDTRVARPRGPAEQETAEESLQAAEFFDGDEEGHATIAAGEPPFAGVALVSQEGKPQIALRVAVKGAADIVTIRKGQAPSETYLWQSEAGDRAIIPLSLGEIDSGLRSTPLEVVSSAGNRNYKLFVPLAARLGETAPSAPIARYEEAPFERVLSDFTTFTGLVILAEMPLDMTFSGLVPRGAPGQALAQLAEGVGMETYRYGAAAFTLVHPH